MKEEWRFLYKKKKYIILNFYFIYKFFEREGVVEMYRLRRTMLLMRPYLITNPVAAKAAFFDRVCERRNNG